MMRSIINNMNKYLRFSHKTVKSYPNEESPITLLRKKKRKKEREKEKKREMA